MQTSMKPTLIAIVGTNASGKSSVGLELARRYGGEIVSADSRQILRGYDLCSGKVTAEERQAVPHHLLDITDAGIRRIKSHSKRSTAAWGVCA